MKELSSNKETNLQKFAVFQNRIFKKEAYVQALENLLKLTKKRQIWIPVLNLNVPSCG